MALQHSTIPIQFTGGLDQKRPAKGSIPGKFLVLENCVRRKFALVEKRFGLTALSRDVFGSDTEISEGRSIATFRDDLILNSPSKIYSHAASNNAWVDKGHCITAHVESAPIVRNSDTQAMVDMATNQGITVITWEDSRGGVRYSVQDDETGASLVYDTLVDATAVQPKVVALRDVFLLCYIDGAALKCHAIARADPTTLPTATTIIGAGVEPADYWDIDVYESTYAVFAISTTVPDLTVGYIDQNGVVGDPVANTLPSVATGVGSTAADDFCSVIGDALNEKIWVIYGGGTEVKLIGIAPNLVTMDDIVVAGVQARNATGVVRAEDGDLVIFYEVAAVSVKNHFIRTARYSYVPGATVTQESAPATISSSVGLASKAFEVGSSQYFTAAHESTLQPTYFTVRHDGVIVTRILGYVGGGLTRDASSTLKSGLPRVSLDTDDHYVTALQVRNRLQIESGGTVLKSNKGLSKVDLSFDTLLVSRTLGQNLHIAGGMLQAYDGVSAFEHGFHVFPEDITKAAAGGGALPAADYSFRVTYEWVDGRGQIHQSAPSITITQTATLNQKITLTVPTLRITNRSAASVKIVVYMAAAGLASVYYRKSETANTSASDTVAIEVTSVADASAATLYTTGGVYENIVPPACQAVHIHKNRMWLGGLETDELWYSKEHVQGEAVAFSDFFKISMESDGGAVNAFASLDSNLVIFKRNRMYYIGGEGPLDTGAQNDYGRPQLIAGDVGTEIPNSVVETPYGLIFKSEKGFYQLTRNYQVKYVGAEVEDFNDLTVTGSLLVADDNEVRFFTSEGTCLVYNYFFNQWSTFTNHEAIAACNGLGTILHLNADGTVQKEVRDSYEDNGARYSMAIETAWFAFAGLQGFQRIYEMLLLGDFVSHHYTRLKVAYDYEEAYNQTVYFDTRSGLVSTSVYGEGDTYGATDPYGGEGSEVYQFRFKPARQKCEAIKLRIEDVDTIGDNGGGSVKFLALTFDIGRKQGPYRLNTVKSIGN